MTISNPSNRVSFVGPGNGFAYPFPVFADADIYVEIIDDSNTVIVPTLNGAGTFDFTVAGTFDDASFRYPNGVTVTLNNALPDADHSIVIENRVSPIQATDYIVGGPVPAERLETDFDRLTVMAQLPITVFQDLVKVTPTAGIVLPPLVPQALRILRWNADANAIESVLLSDLGASIDTLISGEVNNDFLVFDGTNWVNETPIEARASLELGTAAVENVGTSEGNVIQLDAVGLPAVDGSQLTGIERGLASIQVFSISDTWTKPSDITSVVVEVIGAGGGGGGSAATGAGQGSAGAGGGAGGYSRKYFLASELSASETVTIGAGGGGGAGTGTGTAGGNSSFATGKAYVVAANGGVGGNGGAATGGNEASAGGAGGTSSGGDVNSTGGVGQAGNTLSVGLAVTGAGGSSFLGGGGVGIVKGSGTQGGNNGTSFGSGASGAGNGVSQTATTGGSGADGVVIVWEYK